MATHFDLARTTNRIEIFMARVAGPLAELRLAVDSVSASVCDFKTFDVGANFD